MDSQANNWDLVFVHLSDIHFRVGRVGDSHDEDLQIRRELQFDLRRMKSRVPKVDGLIISGDIAFSGRSTEYEYAKRWIVSVTEQLECPIDGVMVTPGNHDVDRSKIPINGEIDQLHAQIRSGDGLQVCVDRLAAALRDKDKGALIFAPLEQYNVFAGAYGCQSSPEMPFWERDFALLDGTKLRVRGINTALLSGERDSPNSHKMLYGGAQCALLREDNVRYVLVGHHPPSWSIEADSADHMFSTLSALQIFGHKHEQWLTTIGNSVRVIAGAIHPARLESSWQPRYTVIGVSAQDANHLSIRIFPRRWSTEELKFIGDFNSKGLDHRDYSLTVDERLK